MALAPTGSRGSGTAAMTQLADSTLSVSAASMDFTGLSQLYNHLLFVIHCRSAQNAATDTLFMRFNGDSSAIYEVQYQNGLATVSNAAEALTQTGFWAALIPGNTATALRYGGGQLIAPHYTSAHHKELVSTISAPVGTLTGTVYNYVFTGVWPSASAVTQATFLTSSGGNIAAGSRITVYGMT
jgi:hypothetical protein